MNEGMRDALWFEDVRLNQPAEVGSYTFEVSEMIAFARKYDPQDFHVDPEAGRKSHFGSLCATGWHPIAAFLRCRDDAREKSLCDVPADEVPPDPILVSFEKIAWRKPVRPGDTLRFYTVAESKNANSSNEGVGQIVRVNTGLCANGELVLSFRMTELLARRTTGPA